MIAQNLGIFYLLFLTFCTLQTLNNSILRCFMRGYHIINLFIKNLLLNQNKTSSFSYSLTENIDSFIWQFYITNRKIKFLTLKTILLASNLLLVIKFQWRFRNLMHRWDGYSFLTEWISLSKCFLHFT